MLKFYKIAAAINAAGTLLLFVTHFSLTRYMVGDFAWFYLPLLIDSAAIISIAIIVNKGEIRRRRYQKKKRLNAPAPSVLGEGTYAASENPPHRKNHKKGKK
jgi:hypothetical protein